MDSEDEQHPNTRKLQTPIPRDTAYWMRTLTFIKIVSYDVSDDIPFEYIVDVASPMHLMLREQQDRRFAFGLLLCHDECFIWYFDRSGLVGSGRIDINKHPKSFIRAVASLALAQPSQLGWDDTMKLGLVGNHSRGGLQLPLRYAYSWDPRLRNCDIPKSPEIVHWRIRVGNQWYTTIETLSADLVSGHASITWLAICQSEVNPEPVVIKQSWPLVNGEVGIRNEEASYQNAGPSPHLPQVRASWTVPGTKTLANLRGDAQSARSFTTCQPLVEREQMRTVLDSFGWPLQDFATLEELLRGLLDGWKGYEHLHNNGIIHRNVSLSNIIMHWKTSEGLLFNADHAKQIDKPHQTVEEMIEKSGNSDSYDLASDQVIEFVRRNESMQNLDKALAKFLLGCSSVLCGVVKPDVRKASTGTFVQYGNLVEACAVDADPGDTLTVEDFGFTPETLFPCIPSLKFITGIRKGVDHNQYIHFTSPWLLGRFSEFEVFHSAIHDMESFFWVLLHICLLHSGPGQSQSSASNNQNTTGEREVERHARADALRTFFFDGDKDTLRVHKRTLFMKGEDGIKDHIFPFIDPYFAPLQQLILDWFRVLEAALGLENRVAVLYLFPTGFFRTSLEKAMRKVASMPLTVRDAERAHIMTKTREEYLAKIHSARHSRGF
ncbi:hypothetical protein BKA70DRAFT_829753 [Coprinopsis sp. MPI-PUGE-AT-0042]|nr:hypothetical protein BKA70DRAFT_829753 [Coprinopsis sp. MPI-PUGE-AT-0042]